MEAKALDGQLVALFMKLSGARKDVLKPFLIKVRKTRADLVRLAAKMMDNEAKTASSPITPPINHAQTLNIPSHRTSSPKRTSQSALDSAEHELEVYIRSLSLARLPAQSMLDDPDTLRTAVEVDLPQVRCNIDECKRSLARYTNMPQADSARIQRANKAWESAHNWAESVYQKFRDQKLNLEQKQPSREVTFKPWKPISMNSSQAMKNGVQDSYLTERKPTASIISTWTLP
jgi:hypothetical protein